ncbi:MAG TPA: squalene synthase HpnC [Solirubrobacteraceae bacterium]|nr:squalene synthase HpnC [Solirubrobacteraceae bacterium]
MTVLAEPSFAAPSAEEVMARAGSENFPVASRLLPAAQREHLLAIYGFARLVDELGDTIEPADRLAALDWLSGELDAAFAGVARHPLMVRLQSTIVACALARGPFERLIEANRLDQRKERYATWEELRSYCSLSADPVGELVLAVFGASSPERIELSDRICTALQLAEHCQDVAEDLRAGRVYIPAEDLARFGCSEDELAAPHASPAVRAVLAFEVARARALISEGLPLVGTLRGRARLAVAAFAAGGSAALEAIERAGYDVLAGPPKASATRRLVILAATLRRPEARRR